MKPPCRRRQPPPPPGHRLCDDGSRQRSFAKRNPYISFNAGTKPGSPVQKSSFTPEVHFQYERAIFAQEMRLYHEKCRLYHEMSSTTKCRLYRKVVCHGKCRHHGNANLYHEKYRLYHEMSSVREMSSVPRNVVCTTKCRVPRECRLPRILVSRSRWQRLWRRWIQFAKAIILHFALMKLAFNMRRKTARTTRREGVGLSPSLCHQIPT